MTISIFGKAKKKKKKNLFLKFNLLLEIHFMIDLILNYNKFHPLISKKKKMVQLCLHN